MFDFIIGIQLVFSAMEKSHELVEAATFLDAPLIWAACDTLISLKMPRNRPLHQADVADLCLRF